MKSNNNTFLLIICLIFSLSVSEIKPQKEDFRVFDAYVSGPIHPFSALFTMMSILNHEGKTLGMYINSGGGYVVAGEMILEAMKEAQNRGVIISCYVEGMAASMAFTILQACDNRLGYTDTVYMQHVENGRKVELWHDYNNIFKLLFELEKIDLNYQQYLNYFIEDERFFNSLEALSINAIDEIIF